MINEPVFDLASDLQRLAQAMDADLGYVQCIDIMREASRLMSTLARCKTQYPERAELFDRMFAMARQNLIDASEFVNVLEGAMKQAKDSVLH